ncbi:MAG: hypothetical protein E7105_07315 [Prevotella sp.]|nr:hypothetical protein [Prevotella sp.]
MKRLMLFFCTVCIACVAFAHSVTLVPNTGYEKLVSLPGVTKVSDGIFGLAVRSGAKDRIVDSNACKLKRCMIFSCDNELTRGKVLNITDNLIIVHATYYYFDGTTRTERIEVLPRTFSRLMGKEGVQKIVCTFDY